MITPGLGDHCQPHANSRTGLDRPASVSVLLNVLFVVNGFIFSQNRKAVIRRIELQILWRVFHADTVIQASGTLTVEDKIRRSALINEIRHRYFELFRINRTPLKHFLTGVRVA